jgi:hypothetical protein
VIRQLNFSGVAPSVGDGNSIVPNFRADGQMKFCRCEPRIPFAGGANGPARYTSVLAPVSIRRCRQAHARIIASGGRIVAALHCHDLRRRDCAERSPPDRVLWERSLGVAS